MSVTPFMKVTFFLTKSALTLFLVMMWWQM